MATHKAPSAIQVKQRSKSRPLAYHNQSKHGRAAAIPHYRDPGLDDQHRLQREYDAAHPTDRPEPTESEQIASSLTYGMSQRRAADYLRRAGLTRLQPRRTDLAEQIQKATAKLTAS